MTRRLLIALVILLGPVAAHAIWDLIEARLLARDIARLAKVGEPVSLTSTASVVSTNEQREAARLYAAAANLASWKHGDDEQLSSREREVERTLTPEELDRFWREVDGEPALDLLAVATPLDFAGFGKVLRDRPEQSEFGSWLLALGALNGLRTDILAARGDGRGAAAALIQTLRLQRTITRQYYRTTAATRYFGSLSMLLRRAPPDAAVLADLQRAFEDLPDEDSLAQEMRTERARLLGTAWPYPPDRAQWTGRLHRASGLTALDSFVFFVMRPALTRETRRELPQLQHVVDAAGLPWPEKLDAVRALAPRISGRFSSVMWPGRYLQSVLPLAGQELAIRRTAIATLAAERYRRAHGGAPPPAVDALVPEYLAHVLLDPFTGGPLLYRVTPEAYAIYSVDRNRVDDGGVINMFGSGRDSLARPGDRGGLDLGIRIPLASR